jgi:hypothetical protein
VSTSNETNLRSKRKSREKRKKKKKKDSGIVRLILMAPISIHIKDNKPQVSHDTISSTGSEKCSAAT